MKEYINTHHIIDGGISKPIFINIGNVCAITPANMNNNRCMLYTNDGNMYLINDSYDEIVKLILKIY